MPKRRISLFLCCILGMLYLPSCGAEKEPVPVETKTEQEKIQIGVTFDSFVIERWQRDKDVFVSAAKKLGAEVNVQNANGDLKEQISQIKYFIDKKMDVIVVVAVDSYGLEEAVNSAKKAGIKVVAYDRLIMNMNVDLFVSFDNEEVGKLMAEALIDTIPEDGRVVMINGPTRDNNVELVDKGFEQRLARTDIEIVDIVFCDEWRSEEAFNYINHNYGKMYNIDGIMCGNDGLAGMTIKGLSERRLAGDIMVVGQDADLDACQRVVEGTQTMTVYKPIEKLAQVAAEYTVKLAKGEDFSKEDTAFDGKQQVPYVKIMPIAVTKENMDEVIIEGGFHLKEDVYLNIPH